MATEARSRRKTVGLVVALLAALTLGLAAPVRATMCADCPDGGGSGGGGGTGGPAQPKPPMIALQFDSCLTLVGVDPQSLVAPITSAINAGFAEMRSALGVKSTMWAEMHRDDGKPPFPHGWLWPSPDVRVHCPSPSNTNVTVWFEAPGAYGPDDTNLARENATKNLSVRKIGEDFAFQVHDGAMKAFLDIAHDYAQQKVDRAIKGTPLEGDVHLTFVTTTYNDTAKRLTTRMDGFVKGQLTSENTDFWTVFTENLSINWDGRSIYCNGTGSFDYGSSVDVVVANIFMTVLDPIVDAMNGGRDLDIDAMMEGQLGGVKGPACQIAPLFPSQYIVPLPDKLVFDYKRITASHGITVGGDVRLVPRTPHAFIMGPDPIYVEPNQTPSGIFRVRTTDMRPPLTVTWQALGGIVQLPNNAVTTIRWNTRIDPGEETSRQVKVTVTDAGGYTRTTQIWVLLSSSSNIPDEPDPPQCYHNPDLCDEW